MKARLLMTALTITAMGLAAAQRIPTVTYNYDGLPGNWILDFKVQNNFNLGEGGIYFFGVRLETGRNIAGSPDTWDGEMWAEWENSGYGGSTLVYNNNWINLHASIPEGESLSGFRARMTGESVPNSVPFFAYARGGTYLGNDHFYLDINPAFEGTAALVPEPASLAVLGLGFAALLRRRR